MHRLQDLVRYTRLGHSKHRIAKLLHMSPNTERAYRQALHAGGLLEGDPRQLPDLEALQEAVNAHKTFKQAPQQVSTVEPVAHLVIPLLDKEAGPKAIFDKLQRMTDLDAPRPSLSALKRFVAKRKRSLLPDPNAVVIPVHTDPGDVAQIDFGYVGKLLDPVSGELRKAYVFVMVLGYSRHMFAKVVFNQRVETFVQCHIEAFEAFGGVPKTLVPDNLKAAVIQAAFGLGDKVELNRAYREMARHYGCVVDPTPSRSPEKKGKVEAGVKYVKRNFFRTCLETDIDLVQDELERWVAQTAGLRTHGTTGRQPLAQFEAQEKQALLTLPRQAYALLEWKKVNPRRDSHVYFDGRFYSLPWTVDSDDIWVQASSHSVLIWADHKRVATHERKARGQFSTHPAHLPASRAELAERDVKHWLTRGDAMSVEVGAYLRGVAEHDGVLSPLPTLQVMVKALEHVSPERAERACARAAHFGVTTAAKLRNILNKGLDALEEGPEPRYGVFPAGSAATFARSAGEFAARVEEVTA